MRQKFSVLSLIAIVLVLSLACGTEARAQTADVAIWEEDDAIAGLRDYFISIAQDRPATNQLINVLLTHDWEAGYTRNGWWLVTGPFLGRPPPAEKQPGGGIRSNQTLQEWLALRRAFDAGKAERDALRKEQFKGSWRISERTGSVLPASTSTLGIIPALATGAE